MVQGDCTTTAPAGVADRVSLGLLPSSRGGWEVSAAAQRLLARPGQPPQEGLLPSLHYITLHYITLHYITLHYITLHYITMLFQQLAFRKGQRLLLKEPARIKSGITAYSH